MRTDQAKRLTKLAAKKIGNPVYVTHTIAYHNFSEDHSIEYRVTYFWSNSDCEGINFTSWNEAETFLKNLALKGLPNVQESDADAL